MFELLFKYPAAVFSKGEFVLLGRWPAWVLALSVLAAFALLGWAVWRRRTEWVSGLAGLRPAAIWLLQGALAALLLLLLWRPAIAVTTLKPRQNIVAVLIDDSRSMAIGEDGKTRIEQGLAALNGGLISRLQERFQVRLYRFGRSVERINPGAKLAGTSEATHIGEALKRIADESTSLPIGAIVLVSDGADNAGGIDLETVTAVRRRRIPVHAIGVGRERISQDLEIADAIVPARALPDSRLSAAVTFRQSGFEGRKARLVLSESGKTLASREITLGADRAPQTEMVAFNAGVAGAKNISVSITPLAGEQNRSNNTVTRLVNVETWRPRVLYLEGEPRWELKFIRRAVEDDRSLRLTSMLRTTQNKIYVQGVDDPKELADGFPSTAEALFSYQGLILGSVESGYFTPAQQELIRQFVDRRGGGLLFLGGKAALSGGGYAASSFTELLPAALPERAETFQREEASVGLTPAGVDSLVCRLEDDPERNQRRWRQLPPLADFQEIGTPKPAALTLVELTAGQRTLPLLVTQNYGRGRTAIFATGGSWRWRMLQSSTDTSHQMFWRQMLRWLVSDSPGAVVISTPRQALADEEKVPLRIEVRDKAYAPVSDARVEARILGPEGASGIVELNPRPAEPGVYAGEWIAGKPGSYVVEAIAQRGAEEAGRDVLTFRREDGVAEHFRTEQNRELLEKLAGETGGRYYTPSNAPRLSAEISYSEAGITTREARDLWNMPAVFLALLFLRSAEWFLRRKWGVI